MNIKSCTILMNITGLESETLDLSTVIK